MNSYSGLGIVIEEKEPPFAERPPVPEMALPDKPLAGVSEAEMLLPPLPDENIAAGLFYAAPLASSLADLKLLQYSMDHPLDHHNSPHDQSPHSPHSASHPLDDCYFPAPESFRYLELQLKDSFSAYELDLPLLNLDHNCLHFPSLSDTLRHESGSISESSNASNAGLSSNTSPMKRLKSLKNGIRKLLFTKLLLLPAPQPAVQHPVPTRPVLSPLQIDFKPPSHDSLGDSTVNSMKSSVLASNPFSTKPHRSRTLSNLNATPTTPPVLSPIITLLENLELSKKSLVAADQSFFHTLHLRQDSDSSILHRDVTALAALKRPRISSIDEMTRPAELLDYCNYLVDQKRSIIDAFKATRARLAESGWCLDHDLNNLQLQQDLSLCQIDTKLFQAEEKLNSEFQLLALGPDPKKTVVSRVDLADRADLSPSLKVLESRCYSFSDV